jgi:glycosyltransferase involved in cell wall biosynthesis
VRIAVVEFAGKGGMIHYAYQLCEALAEAGAQVTLFTDRHYELAHLPHTFRADTSLRLWDPKPDGQVRATVVGRAGRRLRRAVRAVRYYREWLRLIGRLRLDRPDVVQFGEIRFATDFLPLAVLRRSGLRLADVCHNVQPFSGRRSSGSFVRSSRPGRALYRRIYRQFDIVFAHYESNRRALQENFELDPRRLFAIVHGNEALFGRLRDPEQTPAQLRALLGIDSEHPIVLLFGTLTRYKGVDTIVKAMPDILASHPRARLVLSGFPADDFDLEGCRRVATGLGVGSAIRFVPRYIESSAVAAWMELASIAVFPYHEVYQSGALQIALTFGVPVVATRVGAAGEMVRDGDTGLLVPPDDPAALAAAINRLLDDPTGAARLGRAAAADACRRHSWAGVARAMMDEYRRMLEGAG